MKKNKVKDPGRAGFGTILAWKTRDISMAACRVIVTGQLMLYATSILKLDPLLVGTLLMVSKLFDGVTDLLVGYLIDNTKTKWGQARPYELAILGMWLSAWALFSCPASASTFVKGAWVFVMYTATFSVFQTCLAGNGTPYMVRAFGSQKAIVKISSYGGIISMFGSVLVSVFFPMVMKRIATSAQGWSLLLAMFGIPMALFGLLRFLLIKEKEEVVENKKVEKVSLKEIIQMLKVNKYAWFFAGILGIFELVQGLNVMTIYFTYIVGDVGKMGVLHAMSFILLPIMLFFPPLMKKFSVSNLIEAGAVLAIAGYTINWFAGTNVMLLTIGAFMSGLAMFPISYLQSIIIMNLSTYNEYKGLPSMVATTGQVAGFAQKVCNGFGSAFQGGLLALGGYVVGEVATQPESAMNMIKICYSLVPMALFAGIFFFAFKLATLEKQIPQMKEEIAARAASASTEN